MARLRTLLASARLSDRRCWLARRAGGEVILEFLLAMAMAALYLRQLKAVAFGPVPLRESAASWLLLVLVLAWLVLPASIHPSISDRHLAQFPLTRLERAAYRWMSYLQSPPLLVVVLASVPAVCSMAGLKYPWCAMAGAVALFLLAAVLGLSLAMALSALLSQRIQRQNRPKLHRHPLMWRNLRQFTGTLDPYLAFTVSAVAGLTEYFGNWLTPAKVAVPLLLIALLQLCTVLNPFGLEMRTEQERWRLLPTPFWKILLGKHVALAVIFLLSAIPLALALALRLPRAEFCATSVQFLIVLMSWLLTGLMLMRFSASRQIHMAAGSLSGSNMPLSLAMISLVMLATVPVAESIALRGARPIVALLLAMGTLAILFFCYMLFLRRQNWPEAVAQ